MSMLDKKIPWCWWLLMGILIWLNFEPGLWTKSMTLTLLVNVTHHPRLASYSNVEVYDTVTVHGRKKSPDVNGFWWVYKSDWTLNQVYDLDLDSCAEVYVHVDAVHELWNGHKIDECKILINIPTNLYSFWLKILAMIMNSTEADSGFMKLHMCLVVLVKKNVSLH